MHPDSTLQPTDLAYVAGLFDGEGCISVRLRNDKAKRSHKLVISVTNTNREVLGWLHSHFQGTIGKCTSSKTTRTQCYQWYIGSRKAQVFLRAILPYLHIKREQAMLAIAFQDRMTLSLRVRVSDEEFSRRDEFRLSLQRLTGGSYQKVVNPDRHAPPPSSAAASKAC